jgi:uncharacterized protein YlbG (UPF0298 family)
MICQNNILPLFYNQVKSLKDFKYIKNNKIYSDRCFFKQRFERCDYDMKTNRQIYQNFWCPSREGIRNSCGIVLHCYAAKAHMIIKTFARVWYVGKYSAYADR